MKSVDSKNLVNNEEVSNLQSDYEPDPVSDDVSSDFDMQQTDAQVVGKLSGKKKKLSKKSSNIASRYSNLNLVMSRQTSSLSRKNSRGTRKGPTVA